MYQTQLCQFLRQIFRTQGGTISNNMNKVMWIKLTRYSITKIRLYVADVAGNLQPLANCTLNGTLSF